MRVNRNTLIIGGAALLFINYASNLRGAVDGFRYKVGRFWVTDVRLREVDTLFQFEINNPSNVQVISRDFFANVVHMPTNTVLTTIDLTRKELFVEPRSIKRLTLELPIDTVNLALAGLDFARSLTIPDLRLIGSISLNGNRIQINESLTLDV